MRIIMLRSCVEILTPRVCKNIRALGEAGHMVTVLSWDRDGKYSGHHQEGYDAIRVKLKAPYGLGVLFMLPIWWFYVLLWLLFRRDWDVVHAFDFDTVVPAALAAKLKRKLFVYEIADVYVDMRSLPKLIRNLCLSIDKYFISLANAVILSTEGRIEEFGGIPNKNITIIYNSPDYVKTEKPVVNEKKYFFTLFYAGALWKKRCTNLDKVYIAIKDMPDVRLVIAGYGDQVDDIISWRKYNKNIEYLGHHIDYDEVQNQTKYADLLFALYEPSNINVQYASANKLFEAMSVAKPILASEGTETTRIVDMEECGLVIKGSDPAQIKAAIIKLKDDKELCKKLGENGRNAYLEKYNWEKMKQRLLLLYKHLEQEHISKKS